MTIEPRHFPLLVKWHAAGHIVKWWGPLSEEEVIEKYTDKIQASDLEPYIVCLSGRDIGFVQAYDAGNSDESYWPNEPAGTWGIDYFLGEPEAVGKGTGSGFIRAFCEKLFQDPDVLRVTVDPKPENIASIKACEKAGFERMGPIDTVDGPAVLLSLERRAFQHDG